MKGGILEVLLVSAKGVRHTNLLGKSSYYVIIQCGAQTHKSKISSGEGVCWNEKFTFEFPVSKWKHFNHLKFTIMDEEFLSDDGFVGETIIYLGGIITEGTEKGYIEVKPAPYNVVLEDDTYRGEIKIGLKFIAKNEVHEQTRAYIIEKNESRQSICKSFMNLWRSRCGFLFFYSQKKDFNKHN